MRSFSYALIGAVVLVELAAMPAFAQEAMHAPNEKAQSAASASANANRRAPGMQSEMQPEIREKRAETSPPEAPFAPVLVAPEPAAGAAPAMPEAADASRSKALITIRFKQADIYFARSLYTAVAKAVEVKPEVMFDVVSVAPAGKGGEARGNLERVAKTMNEIGVPSSRFQQSTQMEAGLNAPEVRVYAK